MQSQRANRIQRVARVDVNKFARRRSKHVDNGGRGGAGGGVDGVRGGGARRGT